ncbi:zinc ribbon domain-containing protein [Myxococcus sp. K15C18031901]|uniref:zinc ribbon domain-containing protein n=1 Tax=Myxococcus dinghuensis TaxID=2906761 RepID=UPI0020A7E3FC|nr:zinc ribbon domain-containing protein [Myxococcus dinghuensis]MCP3104805.1 zinc ribbon domain-containing protein [Myxococcus dinghuensis]
MPQTLCPNCGHSPIPRGATACPSCGEPFDHLQAYKKVGRMRLDQIGEAVDDDATVFGGDLVTSAVSAHPGPAGVVLGAGAVAWFLRVGGVVGSLQDPQWAYGLVALDLVLALVLVLNRGPAKGLAQMGLVAQLLATAWLARAAPTAPVHLAYFALGVLSLTMVLGEPGVVRRYIGMGLGLGAALASVALVAAPGALSGNGGVRQLLVGSELGYRLELPVGWQRLTREQLVSHLPLPQATLNGSAVGFGDASRGEYGMLWVERSPGQALPAGCQGLLRALGAGTPSAAALPAPPALGSRTQVHGLSMSSGARGVLGCGLLSDGRLVGLAVVVSPAGGASTVDASMEAAFRAVGSGLSLQ